MRKLSTWGIISLAVVAVVAGLIALGGPQTARIAKRDADRLDDLRDIREFVECVAQATDQKVPDSLTGHSICDWGISLNDPHTGVAYRFEKLTDTAYQICADFENPERVLDRYDLPLDAESGCVTWTFRR